MQPELNPVGRRGRGMWKGDRKWHQPLFSGLALGNSVQTPRCMEPSPESRWLTRTGSDAAPRSGHWACPLYAGADSHPVPGVSHDGTRSSFFPLTQECRRESSAFCTPLLKGWRNCCSGNLTGKPTLLHPPLGGPGKSILSKKLCLQHFIRRDAAL